MELLDIELLDDTELLDIDELLEEISADIIVTGIFFLSIGSSVKIILVMVLVIGTMPKLLEELLDALEEDTELLDIDELDDTELDDTDELLTELLDIDELLEETELLDTDDDEIELELLTELLDIELLDDTELLDIDELEETDELLIELEEELTGSKVGIHRLGARRYGLFLNIAEG